MHPTIHTIQRKDRPWIAEIRQSNAGHLYVIICKDCWNDNPVRYSNGTIAYDYPERIPAYAKALVAQAYRWIDKQGA